MRGRHWVVVAGFAAAVGFLLTHLVFPAGSGISAEGSLAGHELWLTSGSGSGTPVPSGGHDPAAPDATMRSQAAHPEQALPGPPAPAHDVAPTGLLAPRPTGLLAYLAAPAGQYVASNSGLLCVLRC